MSRLNFKNKWVVITGASSGLGKEIALYLTKYEYANIIIVARRTEYLEKLKKTIEDDTNSEVKIFTSDLSRENAGRELYDFCIKENEIYAIINNAGLTAYEIANVSNMERYKTIINLNFNTTIELSLLFLEYFKKKGNGGILNIGSMLGLMPSPYQTVYSATKHGLSGFTLALVGENNDIPVTISLFSPGGIETEMVKISGLEDKFGKNNFLNMDPKRVAKIAVKGFKNKKPHIIPGFINKMAELTQRLLPKRIVIFLFERSYRHMDKDK